MELDKELNINPIENKEVIPNRNISPEITRIGDDIRRMAEIKADTPSLNKLNLPGTNFMNSLHAKNQSNKIQTTKFDVGKEAFVELSDGKMIPRFESYVPGMNNEEFLAKTQSTGEKWANGLGKFVTKTGVNVLGGTVGVVEGLINGISKGSLSAVYNSDFNKYLDDLNTKLDYNLANYYTEQERDKNFFQKMTTANFWANDFLGGLSFLTGTIVSEGLWATATGGGSLIASGLRGGLTRGITKRLTAKEATKALNIVKEPGKKMLTGAAKNSFKNLRKASMQSKKIVDGLNTSRFLYTSAGFEGGVEARHYIKETMEEWESMFETQNGRKPTTEEEVVFKNSLTNSANMLFASNVALVGSSNLAILGKMFLNKAPTRSVSNSLFKKNFLGLGYKKGKDGALKAIEANKYQKIFGKAYGIGKAPFTEGFIEEGGQAVMSTAANKYVMSAYDKNNVGDGLSLIESLGEGFSYAYGSKEGLTEVGLGALIGVLGGGFATGFKFNEVSSARKQMEGTVEYVNQFTKDNLIENLKFGARMRQTSVDAAEARAQGNMTNETMSDDSAMIAAAERAYHFENAEQTIEDFEVAIDLMDSKELQEEYGFTQEEADTWKAEKKAQFREIVAEHNLNLEFAESIVGDTPIAGLEGLEGVGKEGVKDLKGAIAYTLTMGKKSDDFVKSIANQIKLTVAGELSADDTVDAITVNEVLRKVDEDKTAQYKEKDKKLKAVRYKLEKTTKAKVELDTYAASLKDVDARQKATAKAAKYQQEMLQLEEEVSKLEGEKTLAFEAMNIPQLTEEVITEEMLDNQAEKVKALEGAINKISNTDPKRGALLKKLHLEYGRAVGNTRAFDKLIKGLMDPETKVATLSGWLGNIINKRKSLKGGTAEMFINMIQNYQKEVGIGGALWQQSSTIEKEKVIDKLVKIDPTLNKEDLQNKSLKELLEDVKSISKDENTDPTKVEPEDITEAEVETSQEQATINEVKKTIETLKARIKDLIDRNAYTSLVYEGSTFDYEGSKPNQEDMDRYSELLDKFNGKNVNALLKRPFNPKNPRGLTKEETEELQRLNEKLNNWKILTGLKDNANNDSVADMLKLISQLESDYELTPTKIEIPAAEIPTSKEANSAASARPLNTLITPDVVVAKKVKGENKYQFSHLLGSSLISLFPGAKLFIEQNNREVDATTVKADKLYELERTEGTKFIVATEDGNKLVFTVVENERLEVDIEAFDAEMSSSNVRIVDFGNSNFMPLFIKKGDEFVPMQGDFVEESINDNEIIILDDQRIYDLPEGTNLRTTINLNERYNNKLLKDYKDGKISKEELINNLKIYVSPEGSANKPVGFLRAIKESSDKNSDTYSKLHLIRRQAAEKALASKSKRVEVGITIPIGNTMMGSPNMSVKEVDGKLVAVAKDITEEELDMIDDYGYVLNGKLYTKKSGENLQYSKEEAIFATTLSKKPSNKNKKVPVIVFKFKGQNIVFPVTLKEKGGTKDAQVLSILNNTEDSELTKIVKLNEFLLENNIDPRLFNITSLESPDIQKVLDIFAKRDVESNKEYPKFNDVADVEAWLEPDHNKKDLLDSIQIGIEMGNKPFNAPKAVLNFSGMTIPTEVDLEIESVNKLESLGRQINSIFDKNNPFAEMVDNSEFYDAWEEVGIDGKVVNESQKQLYTFKKANANIVINAFSKNIPKEVRKVLGDDLIKEVKREIAQFKLINKGVKPDTSYVNEEAKESIKEQENKCNG